MKGRGLGQGGEKRRNEDDKLGRFGQGDVPKDGRKTGGSSAGGIGRGGSAMGASTVERLFSRGRLGHEARAMSKGALDRSASCPPALPSYLISPIDGGDRSGLLPFESNVVPWKCDSLRGIGVRRWLACWLLGWVTLCWWRLNLPSPLHHATCGLAGLACGHGCNCYHGSDLANQIV